MSSLHAASPTACFAHSHPAASVVQSAASAAHQAFASVASASPIKAGDAVPDVSVKINDLEDKINFSTLTGKNILVTVPGAFSPTCSSQVAGYIERYADFQAKGVEDIYVVAVNDMFVVNAWKAKTNADTPNSADIKYGEWITFSRVFKTINR